MNYVHQNWKNKMDGDDPMYYLADYRTEMKPENDLPL